MASLQIFNHYEGGVPLVEFLGTAHAVVFVQFDALFTTPRTVRNLPLRLIASTNLTALRHSRFTANVSSLVLHPQVLLRADANGRAHYLATFVPPLSAGDSLRATATVRGG